MLRGKSTNLVNRLTACDALLLEDGRLEPRATRLEDKDIRTEDAW